jgi:hypothetical protein
MDGDRAIEQPLLQSLAAAEEQLEDAETTNSGQEEVVEVAFDIAEAGECWGEARRILALAAPLSAGQVLSYLGYLVVIAQVGALGPQQLAAVSLGSTFFNITGLSLWAAGAV